MLWITSAGVCVSPSTSCEKYFVCNFAAADKNGFVIVANVEEGDLVQYMGPKVLDARWDDPNGNIQSHIKAVIDVVDIPADPWDCQKIVDTAEQIAGFITEIPGVAFFLASLLCGGSPF